MHFASLHKQKKDNNQFKNKKNNQNCQEIKLYGSPATKELKKKHSSRLVGGVEMGGWGGEDLRQGSRWRTQLGRGLWSRAGKAAAGQQGAAGRSLEAVVGDRGSHICAQINWEEQRGSETNHTTPGLQLREMKPQTSD